MISDRLLKTLLHRIYENHTNALNTVSKYTNYHKNINRIIANIDTSIYTNFGIIKYNLNMYLIY